MLVVNVVVDVMAAYKPVCKRAVHGRGRKKSALILLMHGANMKIITGISKHAHKYTFMIISLSFLLRMKNGSDKSCRENQNTYFTFNNFLSENRAV